MSRPRLWTDEQLIEAVASSRSRREVLGKIGLAQQGGNYATVLQAFQRLQLDTSHLVGRNWSKGTKIGPKRSIEEYLTNKFPIKSYQLKLRLLQEGICDPICSKCRLSEWLNEPIPLELEHKNGDNLDNSLNNLCLLCPNCHAQTPTYRGRNIGRKPS